MHLKRDLKIPRNLEDSKKLLKYSLALFISVNGDLNLKKMKFEINLNLPSSASTYVSFDVYDHNPEKLCPNNKPTAREDKLQRKV